MSSEARGSINTTTTRRDAFQSVCAIDRLPVAPLFTLGGREKFPQLVELGIEGFGFLKSQGIKGLTDWLTQLFEEVLDTLSNLATEINTFVSGLARGLVDQIKNLLWDQLLKVMLDGLTNILGAIPKLILNAVKALAESAAEFLQEGGLFGKIAGIFKAAQRGSGWESLAEMILVALTSALPELLHFLGNLLFKGLMNFIRTIADKIREAVKQAFLKLLEYLAKLFKGGDSNLLIPKQTSDDGTVSVWVIKDKVTKQPVAMVSRSPEKKWDELDDPCKNATSPEKSDIDPVAKQIDNLDDKPVKNRVSLKSAKTQGKKEAKELANDIAEKCNKCPKKNPQFIEKDCDPCKDAVKTTQKFRYPSNRGRFYTATYEYFKGQKGQLKVCRVHSIRGRIIRSTNERPGTGQQAMRQLFFGSDNSDRTPQQVSLQEMYDAGHLIADSLGGPADVRNLVPMNEKLNRSQAWYQFEEYLRKCLEGKYSNGMMEVQVEYGSKGKGIWKYIPSKFTGSVTLNVKPHPTSGDHTEVFSFQNTRAPKVPDWVTNDSFGCA